MDSIAAYLVLVGFTEAGGTQCCVSSCAQWYWEWVVGDPAFMFLHTAPGLLQPSA